MRTTTPFSTISYNSVDFLKFKLDELIKNNTIEFYAFVPHLKEDDELKDHIHLIIFPNGQFDTTGLKEYLSEYDPNMPTQPRSIAPIRKTHHWGDFYMYGLHDTDYLLAHGYQLRKFHYTESDFVVSDSDYFIELNHMIDYSRFKKVKEITTKLSEGKQLGELIKEGQIPIQQVAGWKLVSDLVQDGLSVYRKNGVSHTPIKDDSIFIQVLDSDTGEIKYKKVNKGDLIIDD